MIRNNKFNNNKQESYLYSSQINCMFKIMLKKLIINKWIKKEYLNLKIFINFKRKLLTKQIKL